VANRDDRVDRSGTRPGEGLDAAARLRLERDWRMPMSQRLARMQVLCEQMTAIAGSARRR
jgi:hypothetical protein